MALSKILLFSFLTIFTSCNGQEKTNPPKDPITFKPSPAVIRNFKKVTMAPDFDNYLSQSIYPKYFSGFEREFMV